MPVIAGWMLVEHTPHQVSRLHFGVGALQLALMVATAVFGKQLGELTADENAELDGIMCGLEDNAEHSFEGDGSLQLVCIDPDKAEELRVVNDNPAVLPWGTQPWRRAAGDCDCRVCGKPYLRHPTESGPAYGPCGDEQLTLWRLCDGRLVKL